MLQKFRFLPVLAALLVIAGCLQLPTWPPASDEDLQATVIYRTLQGERRIAIISLTAVNSDQKLDKDKNITLQQTDRALVPLSYRADGIYAESTGGEKIHLVPGRNLTDPTLTVTPDPDLQVLSYIALKGRKPVLKLRTIYKGSIAEKGFALPLTSDVDDYAISDFTRQEIP